MKNNLIFNYSIYTSKGLRPINEDASWAGVNKANQYLAIVCDGIGSQDDSQIASLMTVDVFSQSFQKKTKIHHPQKWFRKNIRLAYNLVSKKSKTSLDSKKIGTTVLVVLITDKHVDVFNLGDTRLYHYNLDANKWSQITKDHNLYNHLLSLYEKDNNIKLDELCKQYANQLLALTRCLESNSNAHTKYDTFSFDIDQGDVLFLATDGVYNFIDLNHVNDFISNNRQNNFSLISKSVVQKALENRSNDNLTSVIFECRPANGE